MQQVKKTSLQSEMMVPALTSFKNTNTNQKRILDGQTSSSNTESGFSNVPLMSYSSTPNSGQLRRNSNTSVASDISFLPRYESPTNFYHMQSDLDISASEVEDNASSSSQLGHLTKEQIYFAFQKSQMRYHKYRGRYTDVAKHYKDLERENTKIRSVLVETQDKALRRMAELREQCSLEQKAKAHLENSLRVDLDEKQYIIDSLKTKVDLLQNSKGTESDKLNPLVNIINDTTIIDNEQYHKNLEILTMDLKDARTEIENLNSKIQEMKANSIVFNSKETDFKKKIIELEEINKQKITELSEVLERERENNLIIAQTKMELHTEIQNRDLKIEHLKHDVESLKSDLDAHETKSKSTTNNYKLENFLIQNAKLIDKVEELTHKCNNYESELLKLEQFKIENQNLQKSLENYNQKIEECENYVREQESLQDQLKQQKLDYENKISVLRDNAKQGILTLESKIKNKLQGDFAAKEEALTSDFETKIQLLAQTDDNVQEIQLKLINKVEEIKNFEVKQKELEELLEKEREHYKVLETNHLELISESSQERSKLSDLNQKIGELKEDIAKVQNQNGELQNNILACHKETSALNIVKTNLNNEIETIQNANVILQNELTMFHQEVESLKKSNSTLQYDNSQLRLNQGNDNLAAKFRAIITDLQSSVGNLQGKNATLTNENELLQNEKTDLQRKMDQLENSCLDLHKLNDTVAELTTHNSDIQHQLKEALQNSEEHQKKITENEIIIIQQKNSITDIKTDLGNLQTELNITHQKIKETESQKLTAQEKLKEEKLKFQSEIQNLNAEVSKFNEHNQKIQSYIDDYKQKLTKYELQSSENETQCQNLTSQNLFLENEIIKLKDLIETSDSINNNLTQELNKVIQENTQIKALEELLNKHTEDKGASLVDKINNIIQSNIKLKETLSLQENDGNNLNIQLQSMLDENKGCKEQVLQLESEMAAKLHNYENVKVQLVEYEGKCKNLSDEIAVLHKQFASYKEETLNLKNIESEYQILKNEKLQVCVDLSKAQAAAEETIDENAKLLNEVAKLKEQENIYNEQLKYYHEIKTENTRILEEISELKGRNNELSLDYKQITAENEEIVKELAETKLKHETVSAEKSKYERMAKKIEFEKLELLNELKQYRNELDKLKMNSLELQSFQEFENLISDNKNMTVQINHLEERYKDCEKQRKSLEGQLRELENQYTEIMHEKQLLQDEIQELKISPINVTNVQKLDNLDIIHTDTIFSLETPKDVKNITDGHQKELDDLNEKLVQYKSLDLTNRSSIQFYENELQKLRNKNENISRKLDETLVTLTHCAELSQSTETEYLKNILYNYMLGKESLVLARVIVAVCKFDDDQTTAILQREQQKQTLLGQLGLL